MGHPVSDQDDRSHQHNGDEQWQESWAFQFYDPVTRVAGYCHMGLQAVRGIADCWMWLSVEGKLITNYSNQNLALPEDDYTDMRLGPLHVKSLVPNLKRAVTIQDAKIDCRLVYEAFQKEPFVLKPKKGGYFAEISSDGHYETLGTAKGSLQIGDRKIEILAYGYDDRSWGVRSWDNMHYRVLWVCFGPDMYGMLYHVATNKGGNQFGWLLSQGQIHEVRSVDFAIEMNNDGVTARGGTVTAWMESGLGFTFNVKSDGSSIVNQRNNFMASPSMCVCEMGGRRGVALLEISELKKPTPAIIEKYGLDIQN